MIYGFSPFGIFGRLVRVEVDIRRGLPGTDIVGLPSSEVREAKERVRVAIRNSGFDYPVHRILINLSPAEIPKIGAGFDLPIALAILCASEQVTLPHPMLAIGELSIRGEAVPVRGTVSAILTAQEHGIDPIVIPERAVPALFRSEIEIDSGVSVLADLRHLGSKGLRRIAHRGKTERSRRIDLSYDDMDGQVEMKWASAICAAGHHNLMYMGPPGTGKTMAARRVSTLLPDLDPVSAREVARVYSMRGIDGTAPGRRPPVRIPHHSASLEGMLGGGRGSLPGEVSLAHNGILILDEATEFRPHVLQALREPVEDRRITISRAGRSEEFPASFQLLLTSNLCPCGKLGRHGETCMCSVHEISRYWRRLGAALLDRIDIRVRSYDPSPAEPRNSADQPREIGDQTTVSHRELSERVEIAIDRRRQRAGDIHRFRNGALSGAESRQRIPLSTSVEMALRARMRELGLSDRAAASVRRVARTIADLDDRDPIEISDIMEATRLRAIGPDSLI